MGYRDYNARTLSGIRERERDGLLALVLYTAVYNTPPALVPVHSCECQTKRKREREIEMRENLREGEYARPGGECR